MLVLPPRGAVAGCGGGGGPRPKAGSAAPARADAGAPRRTVRRAAATTNARAASASTACAATAPARRRARPATTRARPGSARSSPNGGQEPSGACTAAAGLDLRPRRHVRRTGALPQVPGRDRLQAGQLRGAAVSDLNVCDGDGRCRPGPSTICAPFNCDPTTSQCATTCRIEHRLRRRHPVRERQLRPKPNGAVCAKDRSASRGFCTDGVCCNVACKGPA